MRLDDVLELARTGRLYPAVILHGGRAASRCDAAVAAARTLLCDAPPERRPCGDCRHCRRIVWPEDGGEAEPFHPDFQVLRRDLKTATSAEATKELLRTAYRAPFEARGQVLAVAEAESLSAEAADALLKLLEEPPLRSPRHFLLLAPARLDLPPTLRSRSLAVFLGPAEALDQATVEAAAAGFAEALEAFRGSRAALYLLAAAEALGTAGGWEDPRARRPWATAAGAVVRAAQRGDVEPVWRRRLFDLAADLLDAPQWRLRGISHGRLLEGLVSRHLSGV